KLGDPLGEACIAPDSITYGILVADVVRVRPKKSKVDTAFLTYALNSTPVVSQFEAETKGTTRPRVNLRKIRALQIPLVESLDEQRRIVAEIEKQFTRLEVGVVGLRRVQANLKRYRAAVLKAACEGKLVSLEAKLAIQSGRSFETGARLLERILTERRQKWKGKGKYKEPAVPNTTKLPRLPEGWTYASVEQLGIVGEQPVLTGPFGTNLGREDFIETGVPVLTIACLKENGIYLDKAVFVSEEKAQELQRYRLNPGDLLFSRMASVGRAGIVGEMLNRALFNYHIMRLRLEPTVLLPKYYMAYVRGSAQVDRYVRDVNHGATRDGINTEQLLNMQVALPPLAEQERIVAEVERRLSVVEELEAVVSANLQRATRLHQSILRKAFVGELVPNG
ncbi:MAG: restriction endonuclease subunit S, partial [Candidatus Omnitrophica bacterium]|nr:restriction endonuclease subunit S [Candidatus Omnitrophota bacterium]